MVKIIRKGEITYVSVVVILSIVSFFVLFFIFANLGNSLVSTTDDTLCRAFITAKDMTKVPGIGVFFYELKQKCKVDKIKNVDLSKEEEGYAKIATMMDRCWYRYGSGEQDFLSNWDTTGNWCFLCAEISFKDNNQVKNYNDFIEWTKKTEVKADYRENPEKRTYYDEMNIIYSDVSDDEISAIYSTYFEILSDNAEGEEIDPAFKGLLETVGKQMVYLTDIKNRKINSEQEVYVVYRFDRLDKSFAEKMSDAGTGVLIGMGTAVVVGAGIEALVEGAAFAAIGLACGPAAPICSTGGFIFGFVKSMVKSGIKTAKVTDKFLRITKLMKSLGKAVKFSKTAKKVDAALDTTKYAMSAKNVAKLLDKIKSMKLAPDDLKKTADIIAKTDNVHADDLRALANLMDEMKISNLQDLRLLAGDTKKIGVVRRAVESTKNMFRKGRSEQELAEIKKLEEMANEELLRLEKGLPEPGLRTMDYLKIGAVVASGATAGYLASELNDNNLQYVDLLTKEQYFRLCGTQRPSYAD